MNKILYYILFKIACILFTLNFTYRTYNVAKNIFTREFRNKINNLKKELRKEKDFNYILNYKGGPIEPEWEWVKNISIVYTWVDGSDIDLSLIKSKYNGGSMNVNSRDRSADELRYSLRSLYKYLPWHNGTIFIVTDNQIPPWLDVENNRIKIIYHENIIPKHINPTFDSSTIECFLDKIPNIGEIFIYLNDDFFFNNFIHPSFFFSSETFYPKIFRTRKEVINKENVEKIIKENDVHNIYTASVYYTYEIIKKYFDNNFKYYHLAHSAYVCYTYFFEPFRQFFLNELKVVFSHRFRCAYKPVTLYLYQNLLLYANEKLPFNSTSEYKEKLINFRNSYLLSNNSMSNYSFELVQNEITKLFVKFSSVNDISNLNYMQFNNLMNNRNILLYNINDKYNIPNALYEFTEFMMIRYPENTTFEKEKYVNLEKKYLYKLQYINETIEQSNNNYRIQHTQNNYFKKLFFNKKNIEYIKEYLKEKEKLSKVKTLSKLDEEEKEILFNYDGRELEPEWRWVKTISIVYIITEKENNNANQLKYSLRSIEYFLPWFMGTIYIIIQNPYYDLEWLNKNYEHVKIINPKNIVSKRIHTLKEYSKEIIEFYLDKIPFISDKFIYLNANYYFKNYIHPRFFFNKEFFPKYNFVRLLDDISSNILDKKNESFFKTYEEIKKIFGNNYINNYRILLNSPISLYRDLFKPVRKLYLSRFLNSSCINFDLLPMYLISTYNIYGTSQIYFPEYVAGFGDIRNISPPSIKYNKRISYYGFDITSDFILKKSLYRLDLSKVREETLFNFKKSKFLFFSIEFSNNNDKLELNCLCKLLNKLYKNRSNYEM